MMGRLGGVEDYAANNGAFTTFSEFDRRMGLNVLEMRKNGDHATFLETLPEYAKLHYGEGSMHDTVMLNSSLGWD